MKNTYLLVAICLLHPIVACSSKTDNANENATDSIATDSLLYGSYYGSDIDTFSNTNFSVPQTPIPQTISNSNHDVTPDDAYHEGYDEGYSSGYEDKNSGNGERASYDASTNYRKQFKTRYQEGYEDGYSDGYLDGNNADEE